jgi:8-oxo-dGTP pyrophosphatase MutT (NUDIX family)
MIEFRDGKCVFCLRVAGVLRRCGHLLVQRAPGGLILPGGRVEMLEQTIGALTREMWEELAVHIEVGRLLWIVENLFDYRQRLDSPRKS